jgi:heme O synthase-like polyprenyltransferase
LFFSHSFVYHQVYTPLKRWSVWNTEVGGIVGALVPLIGGAAAGVSLMVPARHFLSFLSLIDSFVGRV